MYVVVIVYAQFMTCTFFHCDFRGVQNDTLLWLLMECTLHVGLNSGEV